MSALEQEILAKLMQLDTAARRRVMQAAETLPEIEDISAQSWEVWLDSARALQAEMRAVHGQDVRVDVVALLREVREEES